MLADRDVQRRHVEAIVARAGVDLSPAAAWLLIRLEGEPSGDPQTLARGHGVEPARIEAALAELSGRGLVGGGGSAGGQPSSMAAAGQPSLTAAGGRHSSMAADGRPSFTAADGRVALTAAGCEVFGRLATARRARLAELFSDWPQERHEELAAVLRRLAREIVPDARAALAAAASGGAAPAEETASSAPKAGPRASKAGRWVPWAGSSLPWAGPPGWLARQWDPRAGRAEPQPAAGSLP